MQEKKSMSTNYIRRNMIILISTILLLTASTSTMIYVFTLQAVTEETRQRARGIRNYVINSTVINDITAVLNEEDDNEIYDRLMVTMSYLQYTANLRQIYIANIDENGTLVTLLNPINNNYMPTGQLRSDLEDYVRGGTLIVNSGIYNIGRGNVYSMFWPLTDIWQNIIGVVCMEFGIDDMFEPYRLMVFYSVGLSLLFVVIFSVGAYIFMKKAADKVYKELAYIDISTGFKNRRSFEKQLDYCDELIAKEKPFAVMVFDINNLKIVNDVQGHKAGDALIKNTADMIADILGSPKYLYRIGGDEFSAIITDKKLADLESLYDNLQKEKREVIEGFAFSCASGVARYQKELDENARATFARADHRMYENKTRQKARKAEEQKQAEGKRENGQS